ncbi:MAG: TonB system transport protein ExbD [Candidatus Devosia phytovorans]|uniref:Biopolymer transport protein ExbD n=1 Tax=Candidatus Devosia phytovorans TaxID=3121372 RepID=A0AAJ6B028_9HYPH|nr:TonB system transport protein ExbD [Devosia sp.]WEK03759.1 MAG: TonB system transport protein ExbD [Devosia sp.]
MAGGIRDNGDDELDEQHEINVTPFIDVMLVLLIIFMVAAPLATVDINVDLPSSNAVPQERPDEPVYVTLASDLTLNVNNTAVTAEGLAAALDDVTGGDREQRIFLRADQTVPYGDMMSLINGLRSAGYLKVGLVGLESAPPVTDSAAGQ